MESIEHVAESKLFPCVPLLAGKSRNVGQSCRGRPAAHRGFYALGAGRPMVHENESLPVSLSAGMRISIVLRRIGVAAGHLIVQRGVRKVFSAASSSVVSSCIGAFPLLRWRCRLMSSDVLKPLRIRSRPHAAVFDVSPLRSKTMR